MLLPPTTHDLLFSCLSPKDLYSYSRANRQTHEDVLSFRRRAFSIYALLSPFFTKKETEQFRIVQAETGTLISGSIALQFFNRLTYPDSDLDLYVEYRYCVEVGRFLSDIGYKFIPSERQDRDFYKTVEMVTKKMHEDYEDEDSDPDEYGDAYDNLRGFVGVFNFERPSLKVDDGWNRKRRIQLIMARHCPMHVILHFHSTVVMNVISHSHAYSLYPHATFEDSTSLVCYCTESRLPRQKYIERGWTMISGSGDPIHLRVVSNKKSDVNIVYQPPTVRTSNGLATSGGGSRPEKYSLDHFHKYTLRYVGDKYCWSIALPPIASLAAQSSSSSTSSSFTPDAEPGLYALEARHNIRALEANSWMLSTYPPRSADRHVKMTQSTAATRNQYLPPEAFMNLHRPSAIGDVPLQFRYCLAPEVWKFLLNAGATEERYSREPRRLKSKKLGKFGPDLMFSKHLQEFIVNYDYETGKVEYETLKRLEGSLVEQLADSDYESSNAEFDESDYDESDYESD